MRRLTTPHLQLGLHRRGAVFGSAILLGVVLASGYISWDAVSRGTESTLEERRATARAVARHLDDFIGHARAHLAIVAGDVARAAAPLDEGRARAVLEGSLPHSGPLFSRLHLVDEARVVRVSAPAGQLLLLVGETGRAVDEALRERRALVSDLVPLTADGARGVLFIAPVPRGGTAPLALVAEMRLPHDSVSAFARGLELGRTGHMEVLDGTRSRASSASGRWPPPPSLSRSRSPSWTSASRASTASPRRGACGLPYRERRCSSARCTRRSATSCRSWRPVDPATCSRARRTPI